MTDMDTGTVPELDTADRMRVALRHAGIGVGEMGGYFGVTAHTIGAWINGRNRPSVQTLRLWALRTGVSYSWLAGLPRLDSNQQPSGYQLAQVIRLHKPADSELRAGVAAAVRVTSAAPARHMASVIRLRGRHLRRVS